MKKFYSNAIKTSIFVLLVAAFSSCNYEPQYVYCKDGQIEVINSSRSKIYYSWDSDYCDRLLYPGEASTLYLGTVKSNLDRPDQELFSYKYDNPGYSISDVVIYIDECYKSIFID